MREKRDTLKIQKRRAEGKEKIFNDYDLRSKE